MPSEEPRRIIELDASRWRRSSDFYEALAVALGSPEGCCLSLDGVIDGMVWGGMNWVEPPYTVRVVHLDRAPADVAAEVELIKAAIDESRVEFRASERHDVDVRFE